MSRIKNLNFSIAYREFYRCYNVSKDLARPSTALLQTYLLDIHQHPNTS